MPLDDIPQFDLPVGRQRPQIQAGHGVKGMALELRDVLHIHHLGRTVLSAVHIDKYIRTAGYYLGALTFQAGGLRQVGRHIQFKFGKHRRAPF